MKYYAVKKGKKPGIYTTWDECQKHVLGFKEAEYKSFSTLEEAKRYLGLDEIFVDFKEDIPQYTNATAYIDGSYDPKTEAYSFGCVLILKDSIKQFKKAYPKDDYSRHRNVSGEIKGAGFIIQYAINHGIKEIDLYYDYLGIEKWYTGAWKAKEPISMAYRDFAIKNKSLIKVNFYKVKSHSNVYYNEVVDQLAKEALNIS